MNTWNIREEAIEKGEKNIERKIETYRCDFAARSIANGEEKSQGR